MAYDKGRPLALDYPPSTIRAMSEERLNYLFDAALSRGDTEAEALFGRELGRRTGTTRIQPAWYRTGKAPKTRSVSSRPSLPPGSHRS
jgi:hypothetical protein